MMYILFYACRYMQFYSSQSCSPAELCYASNCGRNIMLSIDLDKKKDKILSLQFDLYAKIVARYGDKSLCSLATKFNIIL